jgi:Sec-independent protein translocase protein TatA
LGIFEILLILVIALIVIPPDDLPYVMRAVGKVLRELRLASNTVMRELSSAIGDDSSYNRLPPRLDTRLQPSVAATQSGPPSAVAVAEPAPAAASVAPASAEGAVQTAPSSTAAEAESHLTPMPESASVSSAEAAIPSASAADVKP